MCGQPQHCNQLYVYYHITRLPHQYSYTTRYLTFHLQAINLNPHSSTELFLLPPHIVLARCAPR